MKALLLKGKNELEMTDREMPVVKEEEALIRVIAVSVCGSDIHSYKGENALLTYPRVMGHEVCGEVVQAPSKSALKPGDRVVLIPYLNCGHCIACRKGKSNCCEKLSVYGVHTDGAMAEFITAPVTHLMKLPDGIDPKAAAVIEPLAISAHAVRRAQVQQGETVLVAGAGPIGVGAAEIAKTYGARVLIADTDAKRREFVAKQFGYEHVLNPFDADYRDQLAKLTNGDFPDKIIDSTGNNHSMEGNIQNLSQGGRMIYVGIWQGDLSFRHIDFHKRETELLGSRAANRDDFEYVVDCMHQKKVFPERFITHEASFSNSKEALEDWISKGGEVFKAVITM